MNIKDFSLMQAVCYLKTIEKYSGKKLAAQEFGVSIDTLNKYIDNLEQELGYKVLFSNGRGSFLTPRGKELLKKSEALENVLDDIKSGVDNKKDVSGKVLIGLSSLTASFFSVPDMVDFFDRFPKIYCQFMVNQSGENNVKISDVDLALTSSFPHAPDAVVIASKKLPLAFFASPKYVSQHGYPKSKEDMIENHRLIFDADVIKKNISNDIIQQVKCKILTNMFYYTFEMVKNGSGIGLMPKGYERKGLVCVNTLPCNGEITLFLVAHRATKDILKIRTVLNHYKNLFKNL